MPTRLLLGCADDCRTLARRLLDAGDLLAVVDDADAREWLVEQGVPVESGDPADRSVLASVDRVPDGVVVATGDADRSDRVAAAARETFPDATVLVVDGGGEGPDRTVDRASVLADRVLDHVGDTEEHRALELRATLRSIPEPVAVLTHDNPDPDAIASAVGLVRLATAMGVDAEACYFGEIAHQENRALVNLLDLQLRELDDPAEIEEYGSIALVDHARPGVNDQLPADATVDVVVDHHPPRGPVEGTFVDLQSGVGATCTIVTGYFERLGVDLDRAVATALLYGVRVDTDDFTREVSTADFEAAAALTEVADESVLERVESPSVSAETFEVIARAIDRQRVHGSILTASVGRVSDRDALAQAADKLLEMEGITTAMVFGIIDETVYVSARARGGDLDLGEVLRDAFDRIGSAGGHDEMAGAQIPVGMLVEEDEEDAVDIVEEVLTGEFLDAVEVPSPASFPAPFRLPLDRNDPALAPRNPGAGGGGDGETEEDGQAGGR